MSKGRTEFVQLVTDVAFGIMYQDYLRIVSALTSRVKLFNYTANGGIWWELYLWANGGYGLKMRKSNLQDAMLDSRILKSYWLIVLLTYPAKNV